MITDDLHPIDQYNNASSCWRDDACAVSPLASVTFIRSLAPISKTSSMHQAWPVSSKSAGYMHTTAMAAPAGAESGKEWMDNEMQGK